MGTSSRGGLLSLITLVEDNTLAFRYKYNNDSDKESGGIVIIDNYDEYHDEHIKSSFMFELIPLYRVKFIDDSD